MGTVLVVAGIGGLLVGFFALFVPIRPLRITTRKQGAIVLAGSLLIVFGGAVLSPVDADIEAGQQAAATLPTSTEATTTEADATTTSRPTPSTTTTTAAAPSTSTTTVLGEIATVAEVIDGDTLTVALGDGSVDTVRLIGINAPESDECFAAEATAALSALIDVTDVELRMDQSPRDIYDRLLRYVWIGDTHVNEELVAGGYAIARRYPPDTAFAEAFESAQAAAIDAGAGMWAEDACGAPSGAQLAITDLVWDPPGNDTDDLNAETVTIQNNGSAPVDLTGWVLKDESASHRYQFPTGFTLLSGETTTVHTGCGTATSTDLYWCWTRSAIWNNDGDTAFLLDPSGNIAVTHSYHDAVTTTTSAPPSTTSAPSGNCDPSYPKVCIPPYPPDLDCGEISQRRFEVVGSDPHGFDGDNDGIGCES